MKNRYKVIRDTREKEGKGWDFSTSLSCLEVIDKKLPTGDYTLVGYENIFVIERKGSVGEFCGNLTQARFIGKFDEKKKIEKQSEIIRLDSFIYPYIILEFTMEDLLRYPKDECWKVRKRVRFTGSAALKKMHEIEMQHKSRFIFAGNKGKEVASSLFKRLTENVFPSV